MYDRARNVVAAYRASKNPLRVALASLVTMVRGPRAPLALQRVPVAKKNRIEPRA